MYQANITYFVSLDNTSEQNTSQFFYKSKGGGGGGGGDIRICGTNNGVMIMRIIECCKHVPPYQQGFLEDRPHARLLLVE